MNMRYFEFSSVNISIHHFGLARPRDFFFQQVLAAQLAAQLAAKPRSITGTEKFAELRTFSFAISKMFIWTFLNAICMFEQN